MINKEFDVAISFASSEREYARIIASIAEKNGLKVFLDELYEAELWGTNLVESLSDIYENKASFCLIVVSKEYRKRIYTNVERRAALDRAIRNKGEYILPIVTDKSWIDGLPKATAYLDLRRKSIISICETLIKKITGKSPKKIRIPKDVHISRMPVGSLSADELRRYLLDLCAQSKNSGVVAFGCMVYDEGTVELRKLLKDEDYWDALDKASGPSFEIFAIKDEEKYEQNTSMRFEMLTAASMRRSRSRGYYFSKLLKEYFGEEKTILAYPSFLLFLVEDQRIKYCRRIPLSRDSEHYIFLKLQKLFTTISSAIEVWQNVRKTSASELWEIMEEKLLEEDYTVYSQSPPENASEAIESLASFFE